MEVLIYAILAGFIMIGVVILIVSNKKNTVTTEEKITPETIDFECCGAHDICEVDRIKMNPDIIEYYDDEELNAYKNINENDYTDFQIDEFREVLYTMKAIDIRFWLISLSRRNINLPSILQEEARQLILNS